MVHFSEPIKSNNFIGERSKAYKILISKPDGKIPLGGTRHRWEDNIDVS
jgi:hypothetical protein